MIRLILLSVIGIFVGLGVAVTPAKIQFNGDGIGIAVTSNDAEARSRSSSRSRSYSRSRSRSKSKTKIKKSTPKKTDTKSLFGGSKKKTTKPAKLKSKPVKAKTAKKKPVTKKAAAVKKQAKNIDKPSIRKARLKKQQKQSKALQVSRAQTRKARQEKNYWRNEASYQRNRRYSSYQSSWGYGYAPGYTYHRGWGTYGYGYTRGGLGVVDYMILYSIFGHSKTSQGATVTNNTYVIDGQKAEVTAVPSGSKIEGQFVLVKNKDGTEKIAIPEGSTITKIKSGTLITTKDGTGVLVPFGDDAYKAEEGYEVPEDAKQPIKYDPYIGGPEGTDPMKKKKESFDYKLGQ